MNTRAKRLIRPPAALPALAAGLCLAAALLLAALFAQPFRPSRDGIAPSRNGGAFGLLKTMLDLELGLFKPPPAVNAVKTLLALEPGLPVGAKRMTARGGAASAVNRRAPAFEEEPGLSRTEPADDLPPPYTAPPTAAAPINDEPPPPDTGPPVIEVTLTAGTGSNFLKSGDVVIRNETNIKVDMDRVMSRKLDITLPKGKPQILIVHTHAHEAFNTYGGEEAVTVVDLGARLAEFLTAQGFEVIHDATRYDLPDFNKAYSSALAGITKTLKEHPGIQVVLDIHRDAIQPAGDVARKPVATVDGEKAAQMMFVVGTNNSGLPHDNWPQNLCLAVSLQKLLAAGTPDLMRPINLRRERFNQHATRGSLILEVGSYGNDGAEAMLAIDLFAAKAAELFASLLK